MNTVVMASLRSSAGKTSLIVGLAETLQKNISYMKPFGDRLLYSKKRLWDHDAALMVHLYGIQESPDALSIGFDHSKLRYMYDEASVQAKVAEMAASISIGKDLLVVEGGRAIPYGESVYLDSLSLARYLGGRLILVISGDDDTILDEIMFVKKRVNLSGIEFGGVIVNKVQNIDDFKETGLPAISQAGVTVLGIVPYQNELTYFSLRYLADKLFAKVLTAEAKLDRTIKHILIGAMSGNTAMQKPIFKKEDKLVITGGDRSDMILAALEARAAGIILTNNILPSSQIISKVEESGTPMMLVAPDTFQIARQIDRLEPLLTKDDQGKVAILKDLVREHVNVQAIVEGRAAR
jgi:hypothetical protein